MNTLRWRRRDIQNNLGSSFNLIGKQRAFLLTFTLRAPFLKLYSRQGRALKYLAKAIALCDIEIFIINNKSGLGNFIICSSGLE